VGMIESRTVLVVHKEAQKTAAVEIKKREVEAVIEEPLLIEIERMIVEEIMSIVEIETETIKIVETIEIAETIETKKEIRIIVIETVTSRNMMTDMIVEGVIINPEIIIKGIIKAETRREIQLMTGLVQGVIIKTGLEEDIVTGVVQKKLRVWKVERTVAVIGMIGMIGNKVVVMVNGNVRSVMGITFRKETPVSNVESQSLVVNIKALVLIIMCQSLDSVCPCHILVIRL